MLSYKKLISLVLVLVLLLTACSSPAAKSVPEPIANTEDLSEIPQEYEFGTNTSPWIVEPTDWSIKPDTESSFGIKESIIDSEISVFSYSGISVSLTPEFIEEPLKLKIEPVILPPAWEGASMNAYNVTLDGYSEENGIIQITIPYPEEATEEDAVGAGYFDEEKNTWEPVAFSRNDQTNEVIISTNHLSIYSCFVLKGENTRYTRINQIFAIPVLPDAIRGIHSDVILEAINQDLTPGQKALDLGMTMTNDVLNFSGAVMSLSSLAYTTDFLDDLGSAFTHVGAVVAVAQLAYDYDKGEKDVMVANALKNVYNLSVSVFGNALMSAAMVSVFAIDFSLSWFIQEALSGRKDIYAEAYKIYYNDTKNKRNARDWYRIMREIERESINAEEFKKNVEVEVDTYTNKFWKEDDTTIGEYQTLAMNTGFSTLGGLLEEDKIAIANDFKTNLATGLLKSVFARMEIEHLNQQQENYRRALETLARKLNQKVTMDIIEKYTGENPKYSGYYVRFGPLSDETDKDQWTGRINNKGELKASFTVLSHMQAGAPSELYLYPNKAALENGDEELKVDFVISVPNTEVIITSEERLTSLIMENSGEEILQSSGIVFEDDYKSLYTATSSMFPLKHLLSQNPIPIPKDNIVNTSLSGSWSGETISRKEENLVMESNYNYVVNDFTMNLDFTQNRELPVKDTNTKAVLLTGTGTYSYDVTVTVTINSTQENMPALFETATVTSNKVIVVNYKSAGNLQIFAGSTKIDDSKDVVLYETEIDNMKTTDIYLNFESISASSSGQESNKAHTVWEDEVEKDESWTADIDFPGDFSAGSKQTIYFKYPIK
ncbi:MAG: hypothetical protein RBR71_07905 [Gudongella sp.]|nr:hypothetical protein [Gudongella sp.]